MSIEQLTRLYTFDELNTIDKDLDEINKQLGKQTSLMERPDSIVQRVFVDLFGFIAMYLLLFFACDVTQAIVNDRSLFGFEWLFFGPYYFLTGAPLMTRVWKSKKFLEDLSELKSISLTYPDTQSCTQIGETYNENCQNAETHPHNRPLRSKLGPGIDWVLRHTIGKHFGGVLGSGSCIDQGTTLANDCAASRVQAAWDTYNFICDEYSSQIKHRATDINWPNTVASSAGEFNSWNHYDLTAYHIYYNTYIAIYEIGSTVFGGHGTPSNLNPLPDIVNYYTYNAAFLFGYFPNNIQSGDVTFTPPNWFVTNAWDEYRHHNIDYEEFIRYFQLHYQEHALDYWD